MRIKELPKPLDVKRITLKKNYPVIAPELELRLPQREAIECWEAARKRRVIISLPTACGKTITALTITGRINSRVLWIAHREELIQQSYDECLEKFPGLDVGIVKAERDQCAHRLTIASIQTLAQEDRLIGLLMWGHFDLVTVDECHHSVSPTYMKVLAQLGCFTPSGPKLLGLTATIERSDKISLAKAFEEIVYKYPIQDAIKNGYLVRPVPVKVPLALNPNAMKIVDGDFATSDLDRELTRTNAAQATAAAIKAHCGNRKTIVFTASVDQAKRTAEECQKLGIKAAWASGEPYMNKTERRAVIEKLANGEIQVASNSELWTEGFDERSIAAIVVARPTKSQGRYCQMAGRGLRTFPHKVDCLLIDIVGATDLGLVTADDLLKITEKKIKPRRKRIVTDVNDEWKRITSYLRSAKLDLVPHGEITFARASDDLYVTVAKDGDMVILRRIESGFDDQWLIEHKGMCYSPTPLALQDAMSACDVLMPEFGGGAEPGSPEWKAAADKAAGEPEPEPAALGEQMSILMNAESPDELQKRIEEDLARAKRKEVAGIIGRAIGSGLGHLWNWDKKGPPPIPQRWGWDKNGKAQGKLLGWYLNESEIGVDPALVVEVTAQDAMNRQESAPTFTMTGLRELFQTTRRLFKGRSGDWIKIQAMDVVPRPVKEG